MAHHHFLRKYTNSALSHKNRTFKFPDKVQTHIQQEIYQGKEHPHHPFLTKNYSIRMKKKTFIFKRNTQLDFDQGLKFERSV